MIEFAWLAMAFRFLSISIFMLVLTRLSGFGFHAPVRRSLATPFFLRANDPNLEDSIGGLLGETLRRAKTTISEKANYNQETRKEPNSLPPSRPYRGNPAITNIALAHNLWSTVLRPNIDSAIDATCGNGNDSVVLAKLLFDNPREDCCSQLLCIDIQQQACNNTLAALARELDLDTMDQYVQVLQKSHAPLPIPKDSSSIALVVYNLGWLPNSDKDYITKLDSTLESIVDAMLMVRIGGMISVITYPKTNSEEDVAVRTLLECAALLSSNVQTWREFLDGIDCSAEVRDRVLLSMDRAESCGDSKQTWRVAEHKKLGMDRAPILLTATRIK